MFAFLAILSVLVFGISIEMAARRRPARLVARVQRRPRR